MKSIYAELALCGRKNECARTDNVFFPISEASDRAVFFLTLLFYGNDEVLCLKLRHQNFFDQFNILSASHFSSSPYCWFISQSICTSAYFLDSR